MQGHPQTAQRQGVAPANTVHAARDTVTVACKLPNGLILRSYEPRQEIEVIPNGTREITVHRETGDQIVLAGTATKPGQPPPILTASGYRLTPNVPKALWDSFHAANRASDLIRNHILYAHEDPAQAEAFTRGRDGVTTGLEGIDPENPGKRVRGIVRGDAPK